jgi:lysophospholipid acyltransferase (LPLAT)-like uncharacterized protein
VSDRLGRARRALLGPLLRAWARSLRVTVLGQDAHDAALARGPVVFACYHGELLPLLLLHRDRGHVGLASQSRDGGRISEALTALGYGLVRGSSSRGGVGALLGLRAALRDQRRSVAITVDGPRGPRGRPQPGALALARSAGAPMLAVRAWAQPGLHLGSWDRFLLPAPFARLQLRYQLVESLDERGLIDALGPVEAAISPSR